MSDDWFGDPFADPEDPAARERERRRRERDERRRQREAKRAGGDDDAGPAAGREPDDAARPTPASAPDWAFPERTEPALAASRNGHGPEPPSGGGGVLGALRRHPLRIFAALAALFLIWFAVELFQPFHGAGYGRVEVTIPKGASVGEVGDLLGEKGVIDSSTLFQVRITLDGKRSSLYPGRYTLAHDMSYGAAIAALTGSAAPPQPAIVKVTIPEGYSRPQTARLVREDGLRGNYLKATVRSRYLRPAHYGGRRARNLEGFLFPDTFEFKRGAPVADLVRFQLEDFKRRVKGVNMRYAHSKNLTLYDVLTLASIIEHEVSLPSQRRLAAAVFYNRLREGMPLGSDATVRFATGNYAKPLTESQLRSSSPYNTRLRAGLPPGPIDSPGLAAIRAAAHPAKADYLFFVTAPGSCRRLAFARTEAEFQRDVERYNATSCKE